LRETLNRITNDCGDITTEKRKLHVSHRLAHCRYGGKVGLVFANDILESGG